MAECLTIVDFEKYESNALDEGSRSDMHLHLESCDSCSSSYARFRLKRKGGGQQAGSASETQSLIGDGGAAGFDETTALDATASMIGAPASDVDATASMSDVTAMASGPLRKVKKRFPQIEGYKILSVLGQGGMGTVYRAVQIKLSRTVALKVLHAVSATISPDAVIRFRREATAAGRLHHTNIIPVYDYGESADGYFYAMELVAGQPLNELVRRFAEQKAMSASPARLAELLQETTMGGPSAAGDPTQTVARDASATGTMQVSAYGRPYFREVARWMTDAADALHYAHEEQIIHRDIKPANLILSTDGRVMIADFGLAKTTGDASVTRTGTLVGTLRYMSPEQAMAKRVRLDHRTDIYSLGATMYELLCFQPAFPGDDHNAILSAIIARDPAAPHKINQRVPVELGTICLKCLEKSPDARYADAKGMADDLRRYLADLPIEAKRPGPIRRVAKFVRRHKPQVIAVTAAVLLIAGVPIYMNERKARLAEEELKYQHATRAIYESGINYGLHQDWAEAEEEFNTVIVRDPNHADAMQSLAWVKLAHNSADPVNAGMETLREVDEICARALRIDPDNGVLWYRQGTARKRMEDYDGAISSFNEAIRISGKTEVVEGYEFACWSNLGAVYLTLGDLKNAKHNLSEGAKKIGATGHEYAPAAWRNLAALELFLKDPSSVESLSKALAANPNDVLSRVVRARIMLDLPDHIDLEGGLTAANLADELALGKSSKAKRIRALAHLRNDKFAGAIEHAEAALELNDMETINHLIIAIAEATRGFREVARRHLDTALAAWPEELRDPGSYVASLGSGGDLWIDSADELIRLRDEANALLTKQTP